MQKPYKKIIPFMFALTITAMTIGIGRIYLTGTLHGVFLFWNLFLAWIPFLIAHYLLTTQRRLSPLKLIVGITVWLLFLPNAPYIITDLIHLHPRHGVPLWYDSVGFFFLAFHGLLLGIISSLFMHEIIERHLSKKMTWSLLTISFVLSGYGIYLGRFLRWNSWDVLTHPLHLLKESVQQLTNPTAVAVTLTFGTLLFFCHLFFYQLIQLKNHAH